MTGEGVGLIENGAIAVEGNEIVAVGKTDELMKDYSGASYTMVSSVYYCSTITEATDRGWILSLALPSFNTLKKKYGLPWRTLVD